MCCALDIIEEVYPQWTLRAIDLTARQPPPWYAITVQSPAGARRTLNTVEDCDDLVSC